MNETYETERLILRPFRPSDASDVQRIAGRFEIANTTLNVPHPYLDGLAEQWIEHGHRERELGNLFTYAVVLKSEGRLVGASSLIVTKAHRRAEVAYWVDPEFWNRGLGTEAARLLVHEAFLTLDIDKIWGVHFAENPASGRIMEKLGFVKEGLLRQHYWRLGRARDAVHYGLLRSDWENKET